MRVYRIEDRSRRFGPYCRDGFGAKREALSRRIALAHSQGNHEEPSMIGALGKHWACACRTRRDLRKWFSGFWSDLGGVRYVVGVYEVREYIEDNGQIIFNRRKAKRIGVDPIL